MSSGTIPAVAIACRPASTPKSIAFSGATCRYRTKVLDRLNNASRVRASNAEEGTSKCRALRASNSLIMSSFVTCNDGMECSTAAIRIMLVREQLFIRSTLRVVLRIKDT